MPVRLMLWFNLFGFRAAHRFPWRLAKHASTFEAMEQLLRRRRERFEQDLARGMPDTGVRHDVATVASVGDVHLATFVEPAGADGRITVVFRAAVQFPRWGLGAWEVFDGLWIPPDGSVHPMSEDDVQQLW
jgi:hypothetical protein